MDIGAKKCVQVVQTREYTLEVVLLSVK